MSESPLEEYATRQTGKKTKIVGPLFLAVVIQVVLVSLTIFVVVLVPSQKEDPKFAAKKTIYLPQRELEHKMAVAEFQQAAQSPMQMEKIQVDRITPASMPKLPEMPQMDLTPVTPDTPSPIGNTLFGNAGIGGLMSGLAGQASSISFLGIEDTANRIVIIVDVSDTVFNSAKAAGVGMDRVKDETSKLIDELNANTLFNVILHRRTFLPMDDSLITATVTNKEFAVEWINEQFPASVGETIQGARSSPKGAQGILPIIDLAFDMEPDVIFLISDGGYRNERGRAVSLREVLNLIGDRQEQMSNEARIHTIHFPDPREQRGDPIGSEMRSIATRNDGKYRTFE